MSYIINGKRVAMFNIDVQEVVAANKYRPAVFQVVVSLGINGQIIDGIIFQDNENEDASRDGDFVLADEYALGCEQLYRDLMIAISGAVDEDAVFTRASRMISSLDGWDDIEVAVSEAVEEKLVQA